MRLPRFSLLKPSSIEEVTELLSIYKQEARLLAGGTALVVDLGERLLSPKYIISLKALSGLNYVNYDEEKGLRIGALVTIKNLNASEVVREKYPFLAQAAGEIGVPALRHMSTVGGNLCLDTRCIFYNQSLFWRQCRAPCFKAGGDACHAAKGSKKCSAVCQADLAPVFVALEGKVKLLRRGQERVISISEFFTGKGEAPNVMNSEELVTEIQLPPASKNNKSSFQKLRIRGAIDFPLTTVAALLDMDSGDFCRKAKFVLGAISSGPIVIKEAAAVLEGKRVVNSLLNEVAEEIFKRAHPIDNLSVDGRYRRKMAGVLAKWAIEECLAQQGE